MKAYRCACFSILLLGAAPSSAHAQAAAETALGVGRAATMAAPLKDFGKRVGAVLDNAGKSLEARKATAGAPRSSAVVQPSGRPEPRTRDAKPAPAPQPAVSHEDPSGVKTGMDYEEVLRRFGPPLFMLTTAPGAKTLCYAAKEASVDADVREGKVVSVRSVPRK